MQNRGQLLVGAFLVLLGAGFLLANVLQISFWAICFPASLILVGGLLLLRPKMFGATSANNWYLFGDVRRSGEWAVSDEEFWLLFGETKLDFTHAQLPVGETTLRINGFIGDVDVTVPPEVGVSVSASGFLVDVRTPTEKIDRFFSLANVASPNYATAERRLHVSTIFFIGDIDVLQGS